MATEEEETNVAAAEEGEPKEEESTATFVPVVQLEEVETATGEEEETAIYTQRSKCYVYGETMLNKDTGNFTWNERGVGDVRFMKHNTTQHIRLLMRQEKTMKIIINHMVDPRIEIAQNKGSDRAWLWRAFDFSEGVLEEKMFTLKFKDSEIADAFKKQFDEAIAFMKDLVGDTLEGGGEEEEAAKDATDKAADEVADALAGLSTSDAKEATKES